MSVSHCISSHVYAWDASLVSLLSSGIIDSYKVLSTVHGLGVLRDSSVANSSSSFHTRPASPSSSVPSAITPAMCALVAYGAPDDALTHTNTTRGSTDHDLEAEPKRCLHLQGQPCHAITPVGANTTILVARGLRLGAFVAETKLGWVVATFRDKRPQTILPQVERALDTLRK